MKHLFFCVLFFSPLLFFGCSTANTNQITPENKEYEIVGQGILYAKVNGVAFQHPCQLRKSPGYMHNYIQYFLFSESSKYQNSIIFSLGRRIEQPFSEYFLPKTRNSTRRTEDLHMEYISDFGKKGFYVISKNDNSKMSITKWDNKKVEGSFSGLAVDLDSNPSTIQLYLTEGTFDITLNQ